MLTRRFGRTDLQIPVWSCGGMRFQQSWSAGTPVSATRQRDLEAVIDRALELGVRHIETARGYGTSEAQVGRALRRHPRDRFVLQTKVAPREDPAAFAEMLHESFARLQVDRIDLFAFHGLNRPEQVDWTLRSGGCLAVVERLQREGRIGHIGFSTHAPCDLIVRTIESDRFAYVNLHYYYVLQDNAPALAAAAQHDMGVFIISPSDKGGRLWEPTSKLVRLCAPLSPMAANDLFCLANPAVHTLSLGAARPSDFDEHLRLLPLLASSESIDRALAPIVARLDAAYAEALGADFAARWREGIPPWPEIPGAVNVRFIVWLLNLVAAYDVLPFARDRYQAMTGDDHWVPGRQANRMDEAAIRAALGASPFRDRILALLREAHSRLGA
jgi:predicted aldo/keto reductase-like oxidoreductase